MDDEQVDLQLAETVEWALKEKKNQIALGATPEEAERNFEQTIRSAWPFRGVHHYTCERCGDTGFFQWRCKRGNRCGGWSTAKASALIKDPAYWRRRLCADESNNYEHEVMEFCHCHRGEGMKRTYDQSNGRMQSDDFAQAGKTKKPSSPTRMWGGGE